MADLRDYRPWLAALLGLAVTGLGHLYLRRWKRAALWVGLAFAVSVFFVPADALQSLADGGRMPALVDLLPVLAVTLLSVVDAFLIGLRQTETAAESAPTDDGVVRCPECGREVDSDLGFCHWCTARLNRTESPDDRP